MDDEKPVPDAYQGRIAAEDEAGYAGLADARPAENRWFHIRHGPHPFSLSERSVNRALRNLGWVTPIIN